MVLKELILTVFSVCLERTGFWAGCVGLERTDFNSFYFGRVCWKELILTVSTLGGSGGLERTVFNSFYFG